VVHVTAFTTDRTYAESLDAADELGPFRDRFVRDDRELVYLNGNSLGQLPVRTQARIADVVDQDWGVGLVRSWEHWTGFPRAAGEMLAEHLLGAAPGQVLVADSTTVNLYKLATAALDAQRGRDVIITDDDNFPTDRYVLEGIARQRGCELRMISSDIDEGLDTATLADALDDRVALVSLSHVAYRSGAMLDLAAVTAMVHEAGGLMLWDLCHAVGSVPVGLDEAGADLAVGCTYKYVNAGPGAPAFLYVREDLQQRLQQPVWGWFGQRDQFAMGPRYEPAAGIGAFATGTPQIIGTVAVEEGARLLGEAGLGRLRAKSIELTSYLIRLADEWLAPLEYAVASPRDAARRGGHVTLRHPEAYRIRQALEREKIITDYRTPGRLRLAPVPITASYLDVWRAAEAARQIAAEKSYSDMAPEPGAQ
jgi:kynureninase